MKVFLSWSGARSKAVAELLHGWLPQVIQAVEPWMSSEMEKGRRWSPEISDRLGDTRFGLLCVTRENLRSPWLLFEAGALSKTPDAYTWTFLHGVSPADVEQPLAQFQHTLSEKSDVRRLVRTINKGVHDENERSLGETALEKAFETFWPELHAGLQAIASPEPAQQPELRSDRDLLEELLELMRSQEHRLTELTLSPASSSTGFLWRAFAQTHLQAIQRITVTVDVPEPSAKSFVDHLRDHLPSAEFDLALLPGTDRVCTVLVRFSQPILGSEAILWRALARASEAAGITIVTWHAERMKDL